MELQTVAKNLMQARWIFAKTMAYVPHYYTLRREWAKDSDFVDAVKFIREFGVDEIYGVRHFKILMVNEFKYWSMEGDDIYNTNLINRKPHYQIMQGNTDIHWVTFA
jgi:hypothetical protein